MRAVRSYRREAKSEKFERAVEMKMAPTRAEALLWPALMELKLLAGLKFRRQVVMLGWIVDFWCPTRRLVVEVDGRYHERPDQLMRDFDRDKALRERLKVTTLRLSNEEVEGSLGEAVAKVRRVALGLPRVRAWNEGLGMRTRRG